MAGKRHVYLDAAASAAVVLKVILKHIRDARCRPWIEVAQEVANIAAR